MSESKKNEICYGLPSHKHLVYCPQSDFVPSSLINISWPVVLKMIWKRFKFHCRGRNFFKVIQRSPIITRAHDMANICTRGAHEMVNIGT